MTLHPGDEIKVLMPTDNTSVNSTNKRDNGDVNFVQFASNTYIVHNCKVVNSPYAKKLLHGGITLADVKHGFSVGNFGLTAASTIGNSTTPIIHSHFERLITWREVLDGKSSGIQIWRKSSTLRNLYNIFYNRRKSLESLQGLLIGLHEEVFGDRVQLYHLLSIYYRICAIHHSKKFDNLKVALHSFEPIILHGNSYNKLIDAIDKSFKTGFEKAFSTFSSINEPIMSQSELDTLANYYKDLLPKHYETMMRMFKYDKKISLTTNMHLTHSSYYKFALLHNFISQARKMNKKNCPHYGLVTSASMYGRGVHSKNMYHMVYSGIGICYNTTIRYLSNFHDRVNDNIKRTLEKICGSKNETEKKIASL